MADRDPGKKGVSRREFLRKSGAALAVGAGIPPLVSEASPGSERSPAQATPRERENSSTYAGGVYTGERLNRVAFPVGGMGAGMFCVEGTGAISHVSLHNRPSLKNAPGMFGAICVKGERNIARIVEGPVPRWKLLGLQEGGQGLPGTDLGLPRFAAAAFSSRFPFAEISLQDDDLPLQARIVAWSPFIPGDADNSSLPVGALEYSFSNPADRAIEAVFSFHVRNLMAPRGTKGVASIAAMPYGFVLRQGAAGAGGGATGALAVFLDQKAAIDQKWLRQDYTALWKGIEAGAAPERDAGNRGTPGASAYVPFTLKPGKSRTIRVMLAWHYPDIDPMGLPRARPPKNSSASAPAVEEKGEAPWYVARFSGILDVVSHWREQYGTLRRESGVFRDAFHDTTLPAEVIDAAAANLSILKSPTVLRQPDGKLWAWEGCADESGCCGGSCTHVWNYAQAVPHLFPVLERSLRETEFLINQHDNGNQNFRSVFPAAPQKAQGLAAADGQLGGILKMYRDWRIGGDSAWMRRLWPKVRKSLEYCIQSWDPQRKGILEESHHNTYDINFWGADSMCVSIYLGALRAAIEMGTAADDDVTEFQGLFERGRAWVEANLFNGEYYYQIIEPAIREKALQGALKALEQDALPDYVELVKRETPFVQYETGCLSDGVIGCWMALLYGLGEILPRDQVRSTLKSIHRYNFRRTLGDHANGQRPGYAFGDDGGLLLCSWPRGGKSTVPFIYSDEVWTGIEYQVASHLILEGMVEEGLEIVRAARKRYDGTFRNPFDEYECGHWYARALSSYSLLQALTGIRYDAVDRVLHFDSRVGDNFRCFLATATGFGVAGMKNGKPFLDVRRGRIKVGRMAVAGR